MQAGKKQKQVQLTPKPAVVDFSNLNDNKKSQFLEFLLRNNISFEKSGGKDHNDYVAKVILPSKPQKQNKQNYEGPKDKNKGRGGLKAAMSSNGMGKAKSRNSFMQVNLNKSVKMATPKKQQTKTSGSTSALKPKSTPLQESKQMATEVKLMSQSFNAGPRLKKQKQRDKDKGNAKLNKSAKNIVDQQSSKVRTTQFDTSEASIRVNLEKSAEKSNKVENSKNQTKNQIVKLNTPSKQSFYPQKQRSITVTPKPLNPSKKPQIQKQKLLLLNTQLKKKTHQQKQICELVNKYLRIFDLRLQGQRPMKWSLVQLLRAIEEIWNQIFVKNTQVLSQKGMLQRELMGCGNGFIRFVKDYFMGKYKNQKLMTSNLINMLYSLSFYIENEKKLIPVPKSYVKQIKAGQSLTSSSIFMQMFQDFLCQIYHFEDLLFFLFIRNIILTETGNQPKSRPSQKQKQPKPPSSLCLQKDITLNYKQIVKILTLVLGNDQQLVEEYKIMILTRINTHSIKGGRGEERELKISAPEFLLTLVEDYRGKRVMMQKLGGQGKGKAGQIDKQKQKERQKQKKFMAVASIGQCSVTSQNTFQQLVQIMNSKKKDQKPQYQYQYQQKQKLQNQPSGCITINENQTDELTFGQETQQNLQKYLDNQISIDFCRSFWQCGEETEIFQGFGADSVENYIAEKLKKKVKEFVSILIDNMSEYNSIQSRKNPHIFKPTSPNTPISMSHITQLFLKKSLNLLSCVIEMNKVKWFEQLKVADPSQQDIDQVEALQLAYRRLKGDPDAEAIGRLCKGILTVRQVTGALEKLISL